MHSAAESEKIAWADSLQRPQCREIGSLAKISDRGTASWPFCLLNRRRLVRVQRDEMEDDRVSHLASSIRRVAIFPRRTSEAPEITNTPTVPCPPSMRRSNVEGGDTRSVSRLMTCSSGASRICSLGPGRPSHAPLVRYRSFEYQAASWDRPRRVIAKIEHHLGELFPRVGFIVTTLSRTNRAVVRFYSQRGTAERWIKEGKEATHWTRLSCHRFRANEVRLLLGVIAYNLGNLLRRLLLPAAIQTWSLTSLQQRLFKTGGRLIRHGRYFTLQLAESYLTGSLFRQILQRIERLAWHPT